MAVAHNLLPRIIKSGLGVLAPVRGITALASVLTLSAPPAQLIVSPFDWPKLMAGADRVFPVRLLILWCHVDNVCTQGAVTCAMHYSKLQLASCFLCLLC